MALQSQHEREKSENDDVEFYSNQRANTFVKAIIAAATTLLLIIPVVVLYLLTVHHASGGIKIGVLLLFVVVFAIALATMTRATRHEMFAASAAWVILVKCTPNVSADLNTSRYCAVLVVFVGNVPSG
jgi:hypothetical protein